MAQRMIGVSSLYRFIIIFWGSLSAAHLDNDALSRRQSWNSSKTTLCTTPICLEYAATLRSYMARNYTSIDPCTNFDVYACDGYSTSHEFRPDQSYISPMTDLSGTHRDRLHAILESQYPSNITLHGAALAFDEANFKKIKQVYDVCMDESAIQSYGITPLQKLLGEFEEVYPKVATKNSTVSSGLTQALVWLSQRSINALITASPGNNPRDPEKKIISLSPGPTRVTNQLYNNTQTMANLTKVTSEMLYILRSGKPISEESIPDSHKDELGELANRVVGFDKKLAAGIAPREATLNLTYSYQFKPLSHMESMLPDISTADYLRALVPQDFPIKDNMTLLIRDMNFYKKLTSTIRSTTRETMHDYLQYQIIAAYAGRLHRNYSAPLRQFENRQTGQNPNVTTARWRACINEIDQRLPHAISALFVQRLFTPAYRELGFQMIAELKQLFIDRLDGFDWMTNETRSATARKVANIKPKIGYQAAQPNVSSPAEVHSYYESLHLANLDFFQVDVELKRFARNHTWNSLMRPANLESLTMSAPTVNAYYETTTNQIAFPAGVMQYPFFHPNLPDYITYGAFGTIAGHELTHAFDSTGSMQDEKGRYREWWDKGTRANFNNKTKCFVNQFSKYSITDDKGKQYNVNGRLTLGENIADAGGLSVAYAAWKKRDALRPDPVLPGFESLSKEQVFFLAFASRSCAKVRPQEQVRRIYTDPHAPSLTRILGTVDNSVAFKQAFNCPVKTSTCEIW